jgi:RNA polymerase primary sigma factor
MIKIAMGLDMSVEKAFPNWISKFGTIANDGKKYFILSDEFIESSVAPISNEGMTNLLLESLHLDIEKALLNLKPREREILKMRCGFDNKESMAFEEIGTTIQLSPERTRQIYEKSLRKLRFHDGKTNLLKSYLG